MTKTVHLLFLNCLPQRWVSRDCSQSWNNSSHLDSLPKDQMTYSTTVNTYYLLGSMKDALQFLWKKATSFILGYAFSHADDIRLTPSKQVQGITEFLRQSLTY